MVMTKRNNQYAIIGLLLCCMSSGCGSRHDAPGVTTITLASTEMADLDSINVDFNFYPARWSAQGDMLLIGNWKEDAFLSVYDLNADSVVFSLASKGNGPGEYVAPSLIRMRTGGMTTGVYENFIDLYDLSGETPVLTTHIPFPLDKNGLVPAYNNLVQINDSVFTGNYFTPAELGIDLLTIGRNEVTDRVNPRVFASESTLGQEFELAANSNCVFAVFRYFPVIKAYAIKDGHFDGEHTYYTAENPGLTLSENSDEWVGCYSAAIADDKHLYLLAGDADHGENARLEIFSLPDMVSVATLQFPMSLTTMTFSEGCNELFLYSPDHENQIYRLKMSRF